jgi:hypothetical protein
MLTKTETKQLDRYISIYGQTFDSATFYQAVANIFPNSRGEQLFESDAYQCYLENLVSDYVR